MRGIGTFLGGAVTVDAVHCTTPRCYAGGVNRARDDMRISEIFYSVQGEGILAGVPSAFVRTTGCPLRCSWCDTPYTSWQPNGETMSVDEVLARLAEYPTRHAVVTGGEPVVAAGIDELCARLHAGGYHVTLETAAVEFKPLP